ncbi:branched-chain amino acid ABC transporter periplasmic protein [Mycolicibacterium chitae]|uniref:Branched-chain amino acid ABC transporter periplasmic protein n=1 Tax=Mycolicibacterium chitae TaxID=1792 RepID=A0A3S4VDA1_MYCCI|nr:branched-chain amino acid ABC transporter periplasmic protein [Mycolicibacterium chitae]
MQFRVGLVIPQQGPAGIFGPSCEAVAELAVAEINERGGLHAREVTLDVIDGGASDADIARDVARRLDSRCLDAVTGWHTSAVRNLLSPIVKDRIPYIYTSLYEGGERTPGLFCTGETPRIQIAPALSWLRDQLGIRSWCLVGDDYIWPRGSAVAARAYCRELQLDLKSEIYVPYGSDDFRAPVRQALDSGAQGVLMLLVGHDAVLFNREFARVGGHDRMARFSPLMEENMLLASGSGSTQSLYVAAAYFSSLATAGAIDLMDGYVGRFGPVAPPLNEMAESCYEGLLTLEALFQRAASAELGDLMASSAAVGFDSPRGPVNMRDGHLDQRVYIAEASCFDFEILDSLHPVG